MLFFSCSMCLQLRWLDKCSASQWCDYVAMAIRDALGGRINTAKALVFVNSAAQARGVEQALVCLGIEAMHFSAELSQGEREHAFWVFSHDDDECGLICPRHVRDA